jgi:hypothetical protein
VNQTARLALILALAAPLASCGRNVFDHAESTKQDDLTKATTAMEADDPQQAVAILTASLPAAAQNVLANVNPAAPDFIDQLVAAVGASASGAQTLSLLGTATLQSQGLDILTVATKVAAKKTSLRLAEDASDTPLCTLAGASVKAELPVILRAFSLIKASTKLGVDPGANAAFVYVVSSAITLTRLLIEVDADKDGVLSAAEIAGIDRAVPVGGGATLALGDGLYDAAQAVLAAIMFYRDVAGEAVANVSEDAKQGAVSKAIAKIQKEAEKINNPDGAAAGMSSVDKLKLYLGAKVADRKCF